MAVGSVQPFQNNGGVSLNAGTVSANATLNGGGEAVLVTNSGTALAFVAFGTDLTVAATSGGMPVLPGAHVLLSVGSLILTAAAITLAGTSEVYFNRGNGSAI